MKPARVLIVFTSSELGGAERSLTRMALAAEGDVQYTLATLDGHGPWVDWCREQRVEPVILGKRHAISKHGRFGLGTILRLVAHVRLHRYSAVYVIGLRASLWLRFIRPWLRGSKLVQGVRWNPNSNSRLDRAFLFVERFLGGWIDLYICNSRNAASTIANRVGIREDKIKVVYNGLERIPPLSTAYDARPINVVVLANINPRKGHLEFLQVVAKIVEQVPEVRFFFVGRDDMSGRLANEIAQRGLGHVVTLTGYQSDVAPWLSSARLMVLPSLWGEGCPTSILEGHAFGLPVVAYAIDGVPELIDDGIDGLLVSPDKPADLADAILCILNDTAQAERMASVGREKVAKRFTLKQCTVEHGAIFLELLAKDVASRGVLG